MFDDIERPTYEIQCQGKYATRDSYIGYFQRAELGLNFALSALGSFLYCLGGFAFMPELQIIIEGYWLYILGSIFVMISQGWKVQRYLFRSDLSDFPGFGVDLFAGLGGLGYLIGCILLLPWYDTSNGITAYAADWFIEGGISFTISGLFMLYRYFFWLKY